MTPGELLKALTIYTPTSEHILLILLSIHFLGHWKGEYVNY